MSRAARSLKTLKYSVTLKGPVLIPVGDVDEGQQPWRRPEVDIIP